MSDSSQITVPDFYAPVPPQRPRKGFAVTALVVGLVAVVFSFIPLAGFFAIILGAIALVFGILSLVLRKEAGKGMPIAGVVLGGVAIVFGIISLVLTAAFVGAVSSSVETAQAKASASHTVTFKATSSKGTASASYTTSGGGTSEKKFEKELTTESSAQGYDFISLTVMGDFTVADGEVGCEILVDGESIQKNVGSTMASCHANATK